MPNTTPSSNSFCNFGPVAMAEIHRNRWIREVPANLCLLYLSYIPLKFSIPETKWKFDDLDGYMEPPKGRFFSINAISDNCWFTIENWMQRRYHTLFLYSFSWTTSWTQLMTFTFHIVPSTGQYISGNFKEITHIHQMKNRNKFILVCLFCRKYWWRDWESVGILLRTSSTA